MPGLKRFFKLWWVSMALFTCLFFAGVLWGLPVVIDDIAEELHMTTALIGITMAIHVVPFGISGPLVSYALNVVGCRMVIMTGGVLLSSGIFLMAFARHIAFIWVGFSLLGGIGVSAIYIASTATIRQHYSDRHCALANGAAITGAPMSMFVFSTVSRALAFAYGWRGALVICSAISLNTVVIGALLKPDVVKKRGAVVGDEGIKVCKIDHVSNYSPSSVNEMQNDDKYNSLESARVVKSTFRISNLFKFSAKPLTRTTKICHVALLVAIFFLAATYMTVNVFMAPAGTRGGLSPMQAATLLSAFGGSQAVGRFFNGILVTKGYVKAMHLFIGAQVLMASASLVLGLLMRVYVVAMLASLAVGVSAGAIISLNIIMQRVIDDSATSISIGWLVFVEGFGGLFGTFALGYLTDSFMPMFVLAAVFTSLSVALSVIILILKKREAVSNKAI